MMNVFNEENLYRSLWKARLSVLEDIIAGGERNLSRVLAAMDTFGREFQVTAQCIQTQTADHSGQALLTGEAVVTPRTTNADDRTRYPVCPTLPTGVPVLAYAILGNKRTIRPFYGSYDGVAVRWLVDNCIDQGFDAIVELGSGFGQRLFELYLAGGPADIPYYGAEIWPEGRQGAELIAALEPGLDFRSIPFDFNAPDYSFLAGHRKVLIFTSAAMYSVTTLPADTFQRMAAAAPQVVGFHFEFVGHQMPHTEPALEDFYRLAAQRKLNTNFVPLLLDAHNCGRLCCDFLVPNLYDVSSLHPVTVGIWHACA